MRADQLPHVGSQRWVLVVLQVQLPAADQGLLAVAPPALADRQDGLPAGPQLSGDEVGPLAPDPASQRHHGIVHLLPPTGGHRRDQGGCG